jgi:NADH-quinone oxidoreductase subunit M
MLWMFQRVMFGELNNPKNKVLKDLNAREIAIMVPLVAMIFVMGVFPTPFLNKMAPAIDKLVMQVNQKRVASAAITQPVLVEPTAATTPETQSPIK